MSKFTLRKSAMEEDLHRLVQVRKWFSGLDILKQPCNRCLLYNFFHFVDFQTKGPAVVQEVYLQTLVPVRGKHGVLKNL